MPFDALTMHAIKDELEARLVGGHIEKVVALSEIELGLRFRSHRENYSLIMSVDSQAARVHLLSGTLRRLTDGVTPFLLLARKYLTDGRIVSIEQPLLERVLRLNVEKFIEGDLPTASSLIIEVMGRHSNVILVGPDGKVLDALKRVPSSVSRQRPILPHLVYRPPPSQEKLNPFSPILARQLATASRQVPPVTPLARFLVESVAGFSPLAAREVAYEVSGDLSVTVSQLSSWQPLARTITDFLAPLRTHKWSPCVILREGMPWDFAPYIPSQFAEAEIERKETISTAIERVYAEGHKLRPAEALRAPLRASLEVKLDRIRRKQGSLEEALARGRKAEGLKAAGNAILANMAILETGQQELHWEGQNITLDPKLSPLENAQRYFREYSKARDAAKEIPALLESVRLEREYLEQMLTHVELAESDSEFRSLSREIAEQEKGRRAQRVIGVSKSGVDARGGAKRAKPRTPGTGGTVKRLTSSEGYRILLGGSAKGNEEVTFKLASKEDIWLHARGMPGAHVVVKMEGQTPSNRLLEEAASIAAAHSQARGSSKVPVDYAPVRQVKKVKGGPPGLVTYSGEKTLIVDALEQR